MITSSFSWRVRLLIFIFALLPAALYAASESYVQSLTGHLKKGDSVTVIDDKFLNLPLDQWNQVKHLSIDDIISFELRRDTLTNYYTKAFTCTMNVTIKYFTSRDQQTPKEIDSVNLVVRYDTAKGKAYADVAHYRFKNAFKVIVVVNSINSPEWKDKLPDCFRLKSQILVERKYPFDPHAKGKLHLGVFQPADPKDLLAFSGPRTQDEDPGIQSQASNGQLAINWSGFGSPDEYDVEWTYVDILSPRGVAINTSYGGKGPFTIPENVEAQWMVHDATRVTVTVSPYTINLPYLEGYVLIRIRAVSYQGNIRVPGDWVYANDNGQTAVTYIPSRQTNLNWQYTGAFAEGGKRKEVMSYADGSLRNRQNVTMNNSDLTYKSSSDVVPTPTAVVQESFFDIYGRPAVSALAAPTKSSLLDYIPAFNTNLSASPYSFADITMPVSGGSVCNIAAGKMNTASGASQYYSPNNSFLDAQNLQTYYFNPYIPDAQQYPFSVTQYLMDNTGRVSRQGGVGLTLQTGGANDARFFYGKPTPTELQRMFGQEVGDASHYLKNMVIDPNGQASVSYIDANGKTIATALSGRSPTTMDPLVDNPGVGTPTSDVLIQPANFAVDAGNLVMTATATYIVENLTGSYSLQYSVNPLALVTSYAGGASQLCNNCYYNVVVTITDPCGMVVGTSPATPPFTINDFTCHVNPQPVTQNVPFHVDQLGTYTFTYSLQLSNAAIAAQTDYYVATNTDLKTLQTFFLQELNALDLSGCYSSCAACQSLQDPTVFQNNVLSLLSTPYFTGITVNTSNSSDPIMVWIANAYSTLKQKCAAVSCAAPSPCDQKLTQLEQDVIPGGQYALYDANALANNAATVFLEPATNVMVFYNQDPAISSLPFTTAGGTATTVGSLSQADFVRAYLQHPEWASLFVVHHIEYCSYLWCKDASNTTPASDNEVSYIFDATLQQNYQAGSDAAAAGYYNHADPFALLERDPWFTNGGRGVSYYAQMQADLQNLTTALGVNPIVAGAALPVKNIIQYIDWVLYCKPTSTSATASDLTNSWNNCSPNDNCRSVTMEWQLYLQYYQQLKSKYYRIAKLAYFAATPAAMPNAGCLDCFIGADPASTATCVPPGALSDYSVVEYQTGNTYNWYIVYNGGKSPFPGSYTFNFQQWTNGSIGSAPATVGGSQTVTANQGDMGVTIYSVTVDPGVVFVLNGFFTINNIYCTPNPQEAACSSSSSGGGGGGGSGSSAPCPPPSAYPTITQSPPCIPDQLGDESCSFESYLVYAAGNYAPVTVDILMASVTLNPSTMQPWQGNYTDLGLFTISPGQTIDLGAGFGNIQLANTFLDTYDQYSEQYYTFGTSGVVCTSTGSTCPALSAFSSSQSLIHAVGDNGCLSETWQPQVTYSGPALTQNVTVPVTLVNTLSGGQTGTTSFSYVAVFTPGGPTTVNVTNSSGQSVTYTSASGCTTTNNSWSNSVGPGAPTCTAVVTGAAPPASMCTDNTLYAEYAGKTRVFNDYTNIQGYSQCEGASLAAGASGATQQATQYALAVQQQALATISTDWLGTLQNVRNTVGQSNAQIAAITDATLQNLVNNLTAISNTYLQVAAAQGTALNIVSSLPNPLPSGFSAPNGYYSFSDAFNQIIGAGLVNVGFGPDLLTNVYPYNKVPILVDPDVVSVTPDIFINVSDNLTAFQNAWNASGVSTFSGYMQQQLTDDWLMTSTQLSDLQTRIANGCTSPYLSNPTTMPISLLVASPGFVLNPLSPSSPPVAWITCSQLATLTSRFQGAGAYPQVSANSTDPVMIQLYQTLYTNYLNHQLGYPLAYADYNAFSTACSTNTAALLYDKPQDPSVADNLFSCAAQQISNIYAKAGQEYTLYIDQIRQQFRNAYVSKCLSNQASANINGNQWEYHRTLYYYDQAGNLEKTVPPEGVHLLSDQDLATIQALPAQSAASCAAYPANVVTGQTAILTDLSLDLQGNAKAMELWLFNSSGAATRSFRMVTPDGRYLVQAAIANGYVFYEEYSLTPDASGNGIDMTLTNAVVATLPAQEVLQNWTYLMIESPGGLNGGALTLFLDGNQLTNVPLATAPPYPFGFEVDGQTGGYTLPATDVSQVQQIRLYPTAPLAGDVLVDYQNSCMNPAGNLKTAYEHWGLFNPPGVCGSNTAATTLVAVPDRGSLNVSADPDPTGTLGTYALTNVTNTFTVEFWVNPSPQAQDNIPDVNYIYAGVDYQPPYAIFPLYGGAATTGHANMGVAVGTNGITVFQHAESYLPAVLDWRGDVSGWTHVAVVYNNGIPSLYVNGALATTATTTSYTSSKSSVSPSYNFGGGSYGWMPGNIDEVRIWSVARTQAQIAAAYSQGLLASDNVGLVGYWPMDATGGNMIHDVSCNGHDAAFLTPADSWAAGGAPITDNTYVPFANRLIVPNHGLPTYYAYNSRNQVVSQVTPDAGQSTYLYDRLSRMVISQSAEQNQPGVVDNYNVAGRFSYTKYDALNRITEAGEKLNATVLAETDTRVDATLQGWYNSGSNRQVTLTAYDAVPTWAPANLPENNLRNRVAAAALLSSGSDASQNRQSANYYSYDYDGNVAEITQENTALINSEKQVVTGSLGLKDIQYQYDLISGKANKLLYQDGKWDQFYYQYIYDADNRLINVYTSRENITSSLSPWYNEANYRYYLHGPLGRMELAINSSTATGVQGLDYAYTLQGWLKGMNGQQVPVNGSTQTDMGGDGIAGSAFSQWPLDVMGYSLGYFQGDYSPIGSNAGSFGSVYNANVRPATGYSLYNGNVSNSTYALTPFAGPGSTSGFSGYTYRYDQLNRLTAMDHQAIGAYTGTATWNPETIGLDYGEVASYDGNGNILLYHRYGTTAGGPMDDLTYNYTRDANGQLLNNKLGYIHDAANDGAYTTDIKNQPMGNYSYDANGNLIADKSQNLGMIYWNAYGKMAQIFKGAAPVQGGVYGQGPGLMYGYDPGGNRIMKTVTAADGSGTTMHYVRDAQGNVLAVYQYKTNASGTLTEGDWLEQDLNATGRIGMLQPHVSITPSQKLVNDSYNPSMDAGIEMTGNRLYELTNHLQNVMVTVTDVVNPPGSNGNTSSASTATILNAQDYYPFGMQMPGRTYLASWAGSSNYRYGFNGKEQDNEVEGVGNSIDYGMRVYDPRAGRFLSVDRAQSQFPFYTPYQYAGNSPILNIDLDGLEEYKAVKKFLDYTIDMAPAPKTYRGVSGVTVETSYNLHGYPVNRLYFWEKFIEKYPNFLDEWNKNRVLVEGRSPIFTGELRENLVEQGLDITDMKIGDVLDHHHLNQGRTAVPVTESEHTTIPTQRNNIKGVKIASRFGRFISGVANLLAPLSEITGMFSSNPDSWINGFGNHNEVGTLYRNWESSAYYTITTLNMDKNSATAYFWIYARYQWDNDLHKYVGTDPIGYGEQYEEKTGYKSTKIYNLEGKMVSNTSSGTRQSSEFGVSDALLP